MRNYLACALLNDAGYLDVAYIERKAETLDIDFGDVMDRLKEIFSSIKDLTANNFISAMQELLICAAQELIDVETEEEQYADEPRTFPDIEYDVHYRTFVNCIDSHVELREDKILEDYGEDLGGRIIDLLNKW